MNNFIIDRSQKEIEQILINKYQVILKEINKQYREYLINPEYINFNNISEKIKKNLFVESIQLNLFKGMDKPKYRDYDIVLKPQSLNGNIKVVVGNLILLKKENKYSVINMKNLEGWIVDFKKIEIEEKKENEASEKSDR